MSKLYPSETGIGALVRGKLGKDLGVETPPTWGIYQVRTRWGGFVQVKEVFYTPTNPQTGPQQAWRLIFSQGVAAWQALSEEEKEEYRARADYFSFTGFNLFMREYLLSH